MKKQIQNESAIREHLRAQSSLPNLVRVDKVLLERRYLGSILRDTKDNRVLAEISPILTLLYSIENWILAKTVKPYDHVL